MFEYSFGVWFGNRLETRFHHLHGCQVFRLGRQVEVVEQRLFRGRFRREAGGLLLFLVFVLVVLEVPLQFGQLALARLGTGPRIIDAGDEAQMLRAHALHENRGVDWLFLPLASRPAGQIHQQKNDAKAKNR